MKKEIDCQVFEDQLDALLDGSLPDEGIGQLQLHALSCPDCAMLLRVHEHLALPSLEELEAGVPEELLTSMWPRIEVEVRPQPKDGSAGVSSAKVSRVSIPARFARPPFWPLGSAGTFRPFSDVSSAQ